MRPSNSLSSKYSQKKLFSVGMWDASNKLVLLNSYSPKVGEYLLLFPYLNWAYIMNNGGTQYFWQICTSFLLDSKYFIVSS